MVMAFYLGSHFTYFLFKVYVKFNINLNLNFCEWKESVTNMAKCKWWDLLIAMTKMLALMAMMAMMAMQHRCDRCVRAGHDLWWREAAGSAEVKSPVSIRTMIYLLEQDQLPYKDGHPSMKHTMQCGHSITNAVLRKSPKLINFHCKQPSCSAVPRCACQRTYIDFCVSMSYFFRSVRIS